MLCQDLRTVELFKDRLRKAANYAGVEYSQTAIAKVLGTNKQTVDRWFSGSEPRPAMIFHIADTWHISARWLATGEGEMIPGPSGGGLTRQEREIIQGYRLVDQRGQTSLRVMVKALGKMAVVVALLFSPVYPVIQKGETAVYYVKSLLERILTKFQQLLTLRISHI